MSAESSLVLSDAMRRLIALSEPLWGGEAEVFRAYWDSPKRSLDTDRLWLRRQTYKEYWDGFHPALMRVNHMTETCANDLPIHDCAEWLEIMHEEFEHYEHFVEAYRACTTDLGDIQPESLKQGGNWDENRALIDARARHRQAHGKLGGWAQLFTEGGHCTLFAEGMKLKGRGGRDDAIATACGLVYEDEFEHMLLGLLNLDQARPNDAEWQALGECVQEQLRCRILMRNAQFSHPLSDARIAEIFAGRAEPVRFDYARAASLAKGTQPIGG